MATGARLFGSAQAGSDSAPDGGGAPVCGVVQSASSKLKETPLGAARLHRRERKSESVWVLDCSDNGLAARTQVMSQRESV